jgi:hypothetical protein
MVSIKETDYIAIVDDKVKCPHCGVSSGTPRPRALIDIVNKHRPSGTKEISFVEYDKGRARWYLARLMATGAVKVGTGAVKATWKILTILRS